MDLNELIRHPEQLDRDTLYELRSMLALYPQFQTVRLLMLQNLYLLHDPSFDEELRRAAIYITDRRVLFHLIEAGHYKLRPNVGTAIDSQEKDNTQENRTISLIDTFLESIPKDTEDDKEDNKRRERRKPTPADAAVDYVSYLLETSSEEELSNEVPQLKGQELIDTFIEQDNGKIILKETPQFTPELTSNTENEENEGEEGVFTETLARIYIKQGRYSKALEIIQRLSLQFPKKSAYFADQIRFLQKLIINNNKIKQ